MCGLNQRPAFLLCIGFYVILYAQRGGVWGQGVTEGLHCEDDWVQVHRSCIKFEPNVFHPWQVAREQCQLQGGDLLVINDLAELNAIKDPFKGVITSVDKLYWWVGLEFVGNITDGQWLWVNNEPYIDKLPKWAPGEPSDESNERCAEFDYQYKLLDGNCQRSRPYICEQIVVTPSPSSSTSTTSSTTTATSTTESPSTTLPPPATSSTEKSTGKPTDLPTGKPTDLSTGKPTDLPTGKPTDLPTGKPTNQSTGKPTDLPTGKPTDLPTGKPTNMSTGKPTDLPTGKPTDLPTGKTSINPTNKPTGKPSDKPQETTTRKATVPPTPKPKEIDFTGCYAVNHASTCPAVEALGISWPETEPGKMAIVQCENGQAKWKCDKKPTCWRGEPDVKQCTSQEIQELTQKLEEIAEQDEIESDAAVEFTTSLSATLQSDTVLSEQDIFQSTKLMDAAKKAKPTNASTAKDIVQNVLKCGSSLVSQEKASTWRSMRPENQRAIASSLLSSVESVSSEMIKAFDKPTIENIKEDNMALELRVVDVEELHPGEELRYAGADNSFSIPAENLKTFSTGGLARLVFIDYNKVEDLLEPASGEGGNSSLQIISSVTSASISGKAQQQSLHKPIDFTFRTTAQVEGQENWRQLCSYWDFNLGFSGQWSQRGCSFWSTNGSHTTCRCDHLTNFAVLLDIHKVKVPEVHATTLSYITYVGIIISIVCLFLSWITFICLSAVQGERNSIHKHLVFCLFIAEVLFLAGIERTDNKIACSIIAGFLHYFFLGSFIWMFIEGIHILFMLVQVFDAAKSRMRYYYIFGYGGPLIAVGVSALVYYEGYGTDRYCWLSTERWFIWSFAGPVAVILLVNLMILIYAMSAVCKHSEYVFTKGKSSNFKGWIQGALALEVLLGLTWVFGYFYIDKQAIVVAYLFTIFNSLQGVFIFIFHCLLNKKVRKEYERFIDYRSKSGTTNTTSKYANGSAGSGAYSANGTRKQSGFLDISHNTRHGSTTSV